MRVDNHKCSPNGCVHLQLFVLFASRINGELCGPIVVCFGIGLKRQETGQRPTNFAQ